MAETITIRTGAATEVITVIEAGPQGPQGQGVPVGGSTGQVLRKVSSTNYDTEWAAAGSGSGSVTSVALAGTGLSISGSPVTTSGTITANVSYGTTAGTACQGNDGRISSLGSGVLNSISQASLAINGPTGIGIPEFGLLINAEEGFMTVNGSELDFPQNTNGTFALEGDARFIDGAGANVQVKTGTNAGAFTGGAAGNISLNGGAAAAAHPTAGGGGAGGASGSINLSGGAGDQQGGGGTAGGSINLSGSSGGAGPGAGGSIDLSQGGGSINTRGTGSIGLGVSGTRTTLTGTATADRAISLPNASGTIALTSQLGGGTKTYAVFTAGDNQPTASSFATLDTRNSIAVLDFDDAATESAVFVGIMPEAASLGSGLTVNLDFMATTATSGNVRWSVAFERCTTDLDSDSFDTATAATAATSGTSGIVSAGSITCTAIDGITAGDLFRLRVQRLGADAADTMTGDAELVAVEIRSAA
jgi:hypothetical protein